MHAEFVDRICDRLPGAERTEPFGPGTVVWTVEGHMFAAYTEGSGGLSLRTGGAAMADKLVGEGRALSAPDLRGGGWVTLPWLTTPPEELRQRIERSFRLVARDGNSGMTGAPGQPLPDR